MPATFQKTIDITLDDIKTKIAYLDDILIKTKGTLEEHEKKLDKNLHRLNKENLAIKPNNSANTQKKKSFGSGLQLLQMD